MCWLADATVEVGELRAGNAGASADAEKLAQGMELGSWRRGRWWRDRLLTAWKRAARVTLAGK